MFLILLQSFKSYVLDVFRLENLIHYDGILFHEKLIQSDMM